MFRKTMTALAVAAALIATPAIAQAAPAPRPHPTETVAPVGGHDSLRPVATPRLYDVDVQRFRRFDRLVFRFRGGLPDFDTRYVRVVREDGSGRRVFVPGRFFLLLRFEPARARDFPRGVQYTDELRNVRGYRLVGDFEGVVTVALGLRERAEVTVDEDGNRLVVDVPRGYVYRPVVDN